MGKNQEQNSVLRLLGPRPLHIDEIHRQPGLSMLEVSSSLAMLEIQDLVHQVGGMHYVLTRETEAAYQLD